MKTKRIINKWYKKQRYPRQRAIYWGVVIAQTILEFTAPFIAEKTRLLCISIVIYWHKRIHI